MFQVRSSGGALTNQERPAIERATHMMDTYNKRVASGHMSKEERDKRWENIKNKLGADLSKYVSKDGSASIDKYLGGRTSKKHTPAPEGYTLDASNRVSTNIQNFKPDVSDDYYEKVKRQFIQANAADDDRETLRHKKELQKLLNIGSKKQYTRKDFNDPAHSEISDEDLFINFNNSKDKGGKHTIQYRQH